MEHTRVGVAFARWNFLLFMGLQIIKISSGKYTVTRVLQMNPPLIVGFTLEAKLVSSKHLIQVHLEILSRSVENMASHLSIQYITCNKSYQSLHSFESWDCCTCTSCTWFPFLIGQVCSQVWRRPYLRANFGFFELRTFPWSPSKLEVGTFHPFTLKVGSKYTYIILEALE